MKIRAANPTDASEIASLLLLAMEDVFYEFIGTNSYKTAENFLRELVEQKGNQYSYENCWVVEIQQQITGVACVYDGGKLNQLRNPVKLAIQEKFQRDFSPEDETQAGEYYIDCVGIHANFQGRGIGSQLFNFLIEEYVGQNSKTLGLLVDLENPKAKKLYQRLGFKTSGQKKLAGMLFDHLQLKAS